VHSPNQLFVKFPPWWESRSYGWRNRLRPYPTLTLLLFPRLTKTIFVGLLRYFCFETRCPPRLKFSYHRLAKEGQALPKIPLNIWICLHAARPVRPACAQTCPLDHC
jgi:hypothetical protein